MQTANMQTAFAIYSLQPQTFAKYKYDGVANRVYLCHKDGDWRECSKQAVQADLERLIMQHGHMLSCSSSASMSLVMVCIILRHFCLCDGFAMEQRRLQGAPVKRNPFQDVNR